jgi:hypothetical protein
MLESVNAGWSGECAQCERRWNISEIGPLYNRSPSIGVRATFLREHGAAAVRESELLDWITSRRRIFRAKPERVAAATIALIANVSQAEIARRMRTDSIVARRYFLEGLQILEEGLGVSVAAAEEAAARERFRPARPAHCPGCGAGLRFERAALKVERINEFAFDEDDEED